MDGVYNNHRFDNAHVSMISYCYHAHHLLKLHCTTEGEIDRLNYMLYCEGSTTYIVLLYWILLHW